MTAISSTHRSPIRWWRILLYAILIVAAIFYLTPVYVLLITGFKSQTEALNIFNMWTLPDVISFRAFTIAWFGAPDTVGLEQGFWNSVQLVVPATLISKGNRFTELGFNIGKRSHDAFPQARRIMRGSSRSLRHNRMSG